MTRSQHTHRYEVAQTPISLRRTNWKQFIREISMQDVSDTQSNISILILCYNNTDNFFALLDTLHRESQRNAFMITIVQNSDKAEAIEVFNQKIVEYKGVTVIHPIHNLGSAGGYAL